MIGRIVAPFIALIAALALTLGGCGVPSTGGSTSTSGGSSGGSSSGGSSGNGGVIGDGGRDNTCAVLLNPLDTGINTGASIKGVVHVKCKTAPISHHLEVRLERNVNGRWIPQNARSWDDIPDTVGAVPKLLTAPCVPGSWRVDVLASGRSATGMQFDYTHTGKVQEVHPSDCD